MKAFITLCTVLTVSLVLNVSIDGVQSAPSPSSRTSTTTTRSTTKKKSSANATAGTPNPGVVDQTADTLDAGDVKMARPKNEVVNNNNNGDGEDDEQLPTNMFGAGRRLAGSIGEAVNRRGTDFLNAGSGLFRMGTGLGNLFSDSVSRQAKNVRLVANEGFEMANGFGDSLGRGTVKMMRAKSEVGRDVAGRMSEVVDAAVEKGKKTSRMGGRMATVPFKVGGDVADVGTAAATIPINMSKRTSRYMTQNALPRIGADKENEEDVNAESE